MRKNVIAVFLGGLIAQGSVMSAGYPDDAGPGSINWPPPGGAYNTMPTSPRYPASDNYIFRSGTAYQRRPRYQPSFHSRAPEYIPPPGEDWPDAQYAKPTPPAAGKNKEGASVQVIPPPNIPVDAVGTDLSKHPQRDWRPMEEGPRQLREPESENGVVVPQPPKPVKTDDKAQAVDVISTPAVPQQATADKPATQAAAPQQPIPDKAATKPALKKTSTDKPKLPMVSGMPLSKPLFYDVPVSPKKASGSAAKP